MIMSIGWFAFSFGCFANEQAKEPAIQQWEKLAYTAAEFPEVDVNRTRLVAGLFISMYFSGAAVDDRFELNTGLPDADATSNEAAAAAGAAYLLDHFQLDAAKLYDADGATDREDLLSLARAASEMAFK
ncbi:MAG: hypothetical protein AAF736_10155, partial [Pseudomonadota bacterium]